MAGREQQLMNRVWQSTRHGMFSPGSSSSEQSEHVEDDQANEERGIVEQLSRKETRDVWTWKFLLLSAISVCAGFLSAAARGFVHRAQVKDYEKQYTQIAAWVHDKTEGNVEQLATGMGNFASWVTSQAHKELEDYPYVVLHDWELHGMHIRDMVPSIESITFCPFVQEDALEEWNGFVRSGTQDWFKESNMANILFEPLPLGPQGRGIYCPALQMTPPPSNYYDINVDEFERNPDVRDMYEAVGVARKGLLGPIVGNGTSPSAIWIEPAFDRLSDPTSNISGLLVAQISMGFFVRDLLPFADDVFVGLRSTCGTFSSFHIHGEKVHYHGDGDLHDSAFDSEREIIPMYSPEDVVLASSISGECFYSLHLYPTKELEENYINPVLSAGVGASVAAIFLSMMILFMVYDGFEIKRNKKVVSAAAKSNEIVQSMFPSMVQGRLFDSDGANPADQSMQDKTKHTLRSVLDGADVDTSSSPSKAKPIADLFPKTTILFADMKGFTAWSSQRQPSDVFQLLETVYAAFDSIAKKRRIFKVETVGDCYVAVCGLPDPRKNHAVVMCRFARECLLKMRKLVRELSHSLGPDTEELQLRTGLHSGPVTAGVLRTDRARFQLFGDTMNTASRMESTGVADKIHLSSTTADLLIESGKEHWLSKRDTLVHAKGKGDMQTFFLVERMVKCGGMSQSGSSDETGDSLSHTDTEFVSESFARKDRVERLIDWASDMLLQSLKKVSVSRVGVPGKASRNAKDPWKEAEIQINNNIFDELSTDLLFKVVPKKAVEKSQLVALPPAVRAQAADFVRGIASLYRKHSFHNFEHCAHVTMSISKLLARIFSQCSFSSKDDETVTQLSCDPVLHTACIIAGLAHDLLHPGVSNATLVKQNSELAQKYHGRCVAESYALDKAWSLLMEDRFKDLRIAICPTKEEVIRFRKFLVHLILATDIMDSGLRDLYVTRWSQVFNENSEDRVAPSTKSTLVLQHLIQASDVSHTMQHFDVYIKWNERLFAEMCEAYQTGHQAWNPVDTWYEGEIAFMDNYVIPLAQKLQACGVFGVSSDEYLNYAQDNRREWINRGPAIVSEMAERLRSHMIPSPPASPRKKLVFCPPVQERKKASGAPRLMPMISVDDFSSSDILPTLSPVQEQRGNMLAMGCSAVLELGTSSSSDEEDLLSGQFSL